MLAEGQLTQLLLSPSKNTVEDNLTETAVHPTTLSLLRKYAQTSRFGIVYRHAAAYTGWSDIKIVQDVLKNQSRASMKHRRKSTVRL